MDFEIADRTIFLTIHGSHAYGMARPESDVDVKGIAIPPTPYFHGYLRHFAQFEGQIDRRVRAEPSQATVLERLEELAGRRIPKEEPIDSVVYGIRKFFKLAADCNPNIIEVLFGDEAGHVLTTKYSRYLVERRDLFLSAKAKFTFSGYAFSQLKRIKTHRRWLLHPPKKKPERSDYGLPERTVIPGDQLKAAESLIKRQVEDWIFLDDDLPREILESVRSHTVHALRDIWAALAADCYVLENGVYRPFVAPVDEFDDPDLDRIEHAAGKTLGYDTNFLELLDRERHYRGAIKQWKQYQGWKKNRNPARAELERKFGYDCYSDDTEFLTDSGWKTFDKVDDDDQLATVYIGRELQKRRFGEIEYQFPLEKFDGTFTGNLYHFKGYHTDVLVTPNHRMVCRTFSRSADSVISETGFEEASRLPDSFEFMRTVRPRVKRYSVQDAFAGLPVNPEVFLRLMGWYLSDGTAGIRDNKSCSVKMIRISQKEGGRLSRSMAHFHNKYKDALHTSLYSYDKRSASGEMIRERILDVRHPEIRRRVVSECGKLKNKRIPRWVFSLSRRMMEILFDAMCGGDGTVRNTSKKSWIYYSSLPNLANDVNELAFHCGWETSLWGPYDQDTPFGSVSMYHVHVHKEAAQFQRFVRNTNVEKVSVRDARIVCFTVPNGTLVTRRNGRIGIHGNSKHAAHLKRLLDMAKEIMTEGRVIVKRPNAEELLAIREHGIWTYDRLIEWAENRQKELEALYEAGESPLPKKPNAKALDALCQHLVEWKLSD